METGQRSATAQSVVSGRLAAHGARLAVATTHETLTYEELARRVEEFGARLGGGRRLVQLAATNDLHSLVAYLAALDRGHPVILTGASNHDHHSTLLERYDPDLVVSTSQDGCAVQERHEGSIHDLHPDLALLLSTSGTTGAAKLVRLSRRNLQSNAAAIADYLRITADDRAATTLPMHYCYGLSVINSHLFAGAGLILTDLSVVDRCFWNLFRDQGGTTFAGVPYTFDLLDRIGFEEFSLPSLRYITQAGGRLAPERVRRYAQLGRQRGWDLVVMYGQTEATSRMAYLPPDLTLSHPSAIGVPIPGGSFRIRGSDIADGDGEGELIYSGPNVMLGYAEQPADLALGATIDELATGDIARPVGNGLYEIVGRVSRFVKPFGLRVDLDHIERWLIDQGIDAVAAGSDEGLVVAISRGADATRVAGLVSARSGLPRSAIAVVAPDEVPRLPNGKPDYAALCALALPTAVPAEAPAQREHPSDLLGRLRGVYADVLCRRRVDDESSFVSLGGDSLSYIEVSTRLEGELGTLPDGWHTMPISELARHRRARRRTVWMETNVMLRAVAIVLVVGNHTDVWRLLGGAHVLLGVAGFNFARFALRSGRLAASIARIAIPSMCVIGLAAATRDDFSLAHALLLNAQLGGADTRWGYWYVEALVQVLVPLAIVLALPPLRRFERRRGLETAFVVLAVGLAVRFDAIGLPESHHQVNRAHEVLWLFAAGWAAAQARTTWHRLAISALLAAAIPGFFGEGLRDAVVAVGMALLVWVPRLPVPRSVAPVVARLATASLYIYLTHWLLYPTLVHDYSRIVALLGSLAAGTIAAAIALRAMSAAELAIDRVRQRTAIRFGASAKRRPAPPAAVEATA